MPTQFMRSMERDIDNFGATVSKGKFRKESSYIYDAEILIEKFMTTSVTMNNSDETVNANENENEALHKEFYSSSLMYRNMDKFIDDGDTNAQVYSDNIMYMLCAVMVVSLYMPVIFTKLKAVLFISELSMHLHW